MATLTELLADAEQAYHSLITGTAVVKVRDQNGEEVTYNQTSLARLLAYIQTLKDQITPDWRANRPMKVYF